MRTKDGGPAFPVNTDNGGGEGACFPGYGMSLRDYFAAKAMQALIERTPYPKAVDTRNVAQVAFIAADAMLAAREAP
jgi:hypothetical protein